MALAFDELLKENAKLKKKIGELKRIVDANHLADAAIDQKDRLFRFMFGNPSNKEWTLELYNALNGSHYEDASTIDFNTIGDVLYVGM